MLAYLLKGSHWFDDVYNMSAYNKKKIGMRLRRTEQRHYTLYKSTSASVIVLHKKCYTK